MINTDQTSEKTPTAAPSRAHGDEQPELRVLRRRHSSAIERAIII